MGINTILLLIAIVCFGLASGGVRSLVTGGWVAVGLFFFAASFFPFS